MTDMKPVSFHVSVVKEEALSDTEDLQNVHENVIAESSFTQAKATVTCNKKESLHTESYRLLKNSSNNFNAKNIKTEPPVIETEKHNYSLKIEVDIEKEIKGEETSNFICKDELDEENINCDIINKNKIQNEGQSIVDKFSYHYNPQPSSSNRSILAKQEISTTNSKPKDKKSLGYTCKSCFSYFASEQNLLVHIYKNQGTPFKCKKKLRPTVVFCDVCNNKYRFKQHLIRHLKTHFSCKFCSKSFTNVLDRDSHFVGHIENKCRFCSSKFESSLYLKDHIRDVHGDKPFECKECKARFTTRHNLTIHATKHSDYKPFLCHICKKAFKVNAKLKNHILTHENGKFTCNICNGTFKNLMSLRGHITHQHPNRKHKCAMCEEEFDDRTALVGHRKKHYQELRFLCKICNKKFKYKQSLIDHSVVHSGEKPYCCTVCSKTFRFKTNLTAHIRNTHKKKVQ